MLYIVRYNPGGGGWAVATLINISLGYKLEDSDAEQRDYNAHNTNLYDKLSNVKESFRTETDTEYDNIAIPIHYEFNCPKRATVIDLFRSENHYRNAWNLYIKEEGWELTNEFVAQQVRRSMRNFKGDFDVSVALDKYNPDYITEFLNTYGLKPEKRTWEFYDNYVEKQIELNDRCTITETYEKFTLK